MTSFNRLDSTGWLHQKNLIVKETVEESWVIDDFTNLDELFRMPSKKSRNLKFEFILDAINKEKFDRVYLEFLPNSYQFPLRYRVAFGSDNNNNRHRIYRELIFNPDPPCRDSCITSYCYDDCKRASLHIRNGIRNLAIDFEVDILEPKPKPIEPRIKLIDPIDIQSHVLVNYQTLLESGDYSDFVLSVRGKEFRVHKAILAAQSHVFKAMFETNLYENRKNRVEIIDIEVDVCQAMLNYIYGGKIVNLKDMAIELLIAADKYQLRLLKSICERSQCRSLTTETVVNAYVIADRHQAALLKSECIAYIMANPAVQSTQSWKMMQSRPDLLMELFAKMTIK